MINAVLVDWYRGSWLRGDYLADRLTLASSMVLDADVRSIEESFAEPGWRQRGIPGELSTSGDSWHIIHSSDKAVGENIDTHLLALDGHVGMVFRGVLGSSGVDTDRLLQPFTLAELMDLAAGKDPGFDKGFFRNGLARFSRFTPEDLGVSESEYERLRLTIESWRRLLARSIDPPERGLGLEP